MRERLPACWSLFSFWVTIMVYLWMECEGWQRFGPFIVVRIMPKEIQDENGNVLAVRDGDCWRSVGRFEGYAWSKAVVCGAKWTPAQAPKQNST